MKKPGSFDLVVSYSQITLFDKTLEEHFNDWQEGHVRQGFSWRPRSVSFGTFMSGPIRFEVDVAKKFEPCPEAQRAIKVPFEVLPSSRVVVAVLCDERVVEVPDGSFELIFEHGLRASNDSMWGRFTFVPCARPMPAILIADDELQPPKELIMHADPAWDPKRSNKS